MVDRRCLDFSLEGLSALSLCYKDKLFYGHFLYLFTHYYISEDDRQVEKMREMAVPFAPPYSI